MILRVKGWLVGFGCNDFFFLGVIGIGEILFIILLIIFWKVFFIILIIWVLEFCVNIWGLVIILFKMFCWFDIKELLLVIDVKLEVFIWVNKFWVCVIVNVSFLVIFGFIVDFIGIVKFRLFLICVVLNWSVLVIDSLVSDVVRWMVFDSVVVIFSYGSGSCWSFVSLTMFRVCWIIFWCFILFLLMVIFWMLYLIFCSIWSFDDIWDLFLCWFIDIWLCKELGGKLFGSWLVCRFFWWILIFLFWGGGMGWDL